MSQTQVQAQAQASQSGTQEKKKKEKRRIKAVFFDFMGTCLDWHSGVVEALPAAIPEPARSRMALDWREEFFSELHARSARGLLPEDIDVTHRRTLLRVLRREAYGDERRHFVGLLDGATATATDVPATDVPNTNIPSVEDAVRSWHKMAPWPDVAPALAALKSEQPGLELFVLANGTTRLQLDLVQSSGLGHLFSMLFSSELLGVYKPAPEAYAKALGLVRARPDEAVMVAAHAYDLRAARGLGMRTVYVCRWTDDGNEDMDAVRGENDAFLGGEGDGMQGLPAAIAALGQAGRPCCMAA
ncbi:HAD-like protein [Hypoxylon rubiginosum]|uniref:HAD-like protein n=1 Tax=Hypoxylon rubiginosum TaxID=110542 RepID=A0ACB9YP43_9PEZI|nr:HAD-like protein [Hypoxylon rubiginosum]